jgi:hypothetical protein
MDASKDQLEKYAVLLSKQNACDICCSTDQNQFPQLCETIRMLLFKKYVEANDRKNSFLQCIVIILMVLTIFMAGIQCYVMLKPNSQFVKQIELLQDIKSQLSLNQHPLGKKCNTEKNT